MIKQQRDRFFQTFTCPENRARDTVGALIQRIPSKNYFLGLESDSVRMISRMLLEAIRN